MLLTALVVASLIGCAAPTYRKATFYYDQEHSKAYNIARIAGFRNVKDVSLSPEEYASISQELAAQDVITNSSELGIYTASMGYYSHLFSAMDLTFMGIGLVANLFKADKAETNNHIFGWTSLDAGADPKIFLREIAIQSNDIAKQVISDSFPFSPVLEKGPDELPSARAEGYLLTLTADHDPKCTNESPFRTCSFNTWHTLAPFDVYGEQFSGIIQAPLPSFIEDQSGQSYIFRIQLIDSIIKQGVPFNSFEIYQRLSTQLPHGSYIFLAPKRYIYKNEGGDYRAGLAPMILDQGKVLLFVRED